MRHVVKKPFMMTTHLPMFFLSGIMMGYGILTFLINRWLSARVMRGIISVGAYQKQMTGLTATIGLIATLLLLVFSVWCAIQARGIVRTAFVFVVLASFGPLMVAQASNLLFNVIGLPTMGAGSVIAATFAALIFTLPMVIAFILLAASRRNPRAGRWVALTAVFVTLVTMVYPLYVTVLALLIMPGSPGLAPHMTTSAYLLYLRFALPGLCLLLLAWISLRLLGSQRGPVMQDSPK
ncbi:MAG: hypothetical protein SCM11_07165 [Bacillota bacterium]|nr:hypothetical protein [Bacillota bacterium]